MLSHGCLKLNELWRLLVDLLQNLQGSPTLLLESYLPTDFSSNPNQTHLSQLIKVFKACTCHTGVLGAGLELKSAGR